MRLFTLILAACIPVFILFALGPYGLLLGGGILLGLMIYALILLKDIKELLIIRRDFKAENRHFIRERDHGNTGP
jgi:hypothetical protein